MIPRKHSRKSFPQFNSLFRITFRFHFNSAFILGAKQNIFPPTLKTSTSPHKISVVTNFKLWQYSVSSSIFMDTKLHNVYELLNFSPRKYLSLNAVYKYKSAVRIKSLFCADNERFTLLIQNKIKYPAIKKQHKYGQKRR